MSASASPAQYRPESGRYATTLNGIPRAKARTRARAHEIILLQRYSENGESAVEFHQLEQFLAIASSKTMRKAAEALHLSQPTLSHNLKKLESELGHPLFDRSHNRMSLTPYGEILLRYTSHMLDDWHKMCDELAEEERREASIVRVGCYSVVRTFFEMPQLALAFPNLNFEVWVQTVDEIVESFEVGRFDLAVVPRTKATAPLELSLIEREQAYLSVPKSTHLAKRASLALDDLVGSHFFVPIDIEGLSDWYLSILEAAGIDGAYIELTQRETYLRKLDTTLKCHFSTSLMQRLTNSGSGRIEIPLEDPIAYRDVCFACAKGDDRLDPVAGFIRNNASSTFSGHAYLPFVLGHGGVGNLKVHDSQHVIA